MLKGLEISVVKYSEIREKNLDFRIEAEHYQRKYQNLLEKLEKKNCKCLKELVTRQIQTGHTPSMKRTEFYGGAIKFVKTDNLRNNEIKEPFTNYLTELGNEEIKRTELKEGDIITTIIGATYDVIARSCIVSKNLLPANINQNIARICPDKNKISPEYLNLYLNSKYGKMYLEYLSRQMEQVNLNCEEVGMVKIPIFSQPFQLQIESLVKDAHQNLQNAKEFYQKASDLLLQELNLKNFAPKNTLYTTKKLSDYQKSGRLDAEYYQSKYDEIEKIIKSYKGGYAKLKDFIENYSTGFPYKSESFVENGIPLIRITNIHDGELDLSSVVNIPSKDIDLSPKDIAKENDILISMSGTIGSSCKIPKNITAVINQRIMRITPKNYNFDVLPLIINSFICKEQLARIGTGGVQTNISSSDISNILIPILPSQTQEQIAQLVQNSFSAKAKSKLLLDQAKKMVEEEIEKG